MANFFAEWQVPAIWALIALGVAYGLETPKPPVPMTLPDQDKQTPPETVDGLRLFPPVFGSVHLPPARKTIP